MSIEPVSVRQDARNGQGGRHQLPQRKCRLCVAAPTRRGHIRHERIRERSPRNVRNLNLGLAVLCFAYVLVPRELGTTSGAATRLIPAIIVCTIGLIGAPSIRRPVLIAALLSVCITVRSIDVYSAWNPLTARIFTLGALRLLTPGSRILPVGSLKGPLTRKDIECNFHCWSVIEKGCFDPRLFAIAGQHVIRQFDPQAYVNSVDPSEWDIDRSVDPSDWDADRIAAFYDYIWLMKLDDRPIQTPTGFDLVFEGGSLRLYRRNRRSSHTELEMNGSPQHVAKSQILARVVRGESRTP